MKKKIAVLLCMVCISTGLSGMAGTPAGAASKTTITSLDYLYSDLHDTDTEAKYINSKDPKSVVAGGKLRLDLADKYGSKDSGYSFTKGGGLLFASLNADGRRKLEWSGDEDKFQDGGTEVYAPVITAGKKNLWDVKNLPYFEIQFSTKGYEDIDFALSIGATKKGPKSYAMSYRVGSSGSYSALSGSSASLTLSDNKKYTRMSATLPDAAKNKDVVMVKISATTASTVGGGTLTDNPTGGKIGINHISVQGAAIKATPTKEPPAKAPEKTNAPEQASGSQEQKPSASGQGGEKSQKEPQSKDQNGISKARLSKVSLKKRKVTVSIRKMSGVTGYQVQAAGNHKMTKKVRSVYVTGTKAVIRKWGTGTCYVRVRAYKTKTSGKSTYGAWSSVKKCQSK